MFLNFKAAILQEHHWSEKNVTEIYQFLPVKTEPDNCAKT